MPRASATIEIGKAAPEIFDLIHDYSCRLEWDTLLRRAELLGGAEKAGKGVRSVCVGKWMVGGMAMETVYVSFVPGEVAAIKLVNRPRFFNSFAATIKHEDLGAGRSRVTYIYNFTSRPRWLAWLLEPMMNAVLKKEVRHRLAALKAHMERVDR